MNTFLKYAIRKVVYIVVGVGTVAAGGYLFGKPDISSWTSEGLLAAIESAIAGALLSPILGGALAKKNREEE